MQTQGEPPPPPQLSSDGKFYWDGEGWIPLPQRIHALSPLTADVLTASTPAETFAQESPPALPIPDLSQPIGERGGPARQVFDRRRRNSTIAWATSLAGLLIAVIVLGILWYSDDSRLNNRVNTLSSQLDGAQSQLADTKVQLSAAQQEAARPTVTTWTACGTAGCSLAPNGWREGSVPDTFTFHLRFTANGDVFFAFLTLQEYVRFNECPSYVYAVDRSVNRLAAGCIDYWIFNNKAPTDRVGWFPVGTNVNYDFHYAEGCASWVLVLMPEKSGVTVTIQPQIAVTYNPATAPTAGCT